MLITRRKQGESLLIGDQIEVVVLEVSQGRVKLGVVAPLEVTVERKEWRLVQAQNRSAFGSASSPFVQGMLARGSVGAGAIEASSPFQIGAGFRSAFSSPTQDASVRAQDARVRTQKAPVPGEPDHGRGAGVRGVADSAEHDSQRTEPGYKI